MSLLDEAGALLLKLEAKAGEAIEEKSEGWLNELIDEGRSLAGEELDGVLRDGALVVLDELDANKKPFVRLGKVGFAWLVGHYSSGKVSEAKLKYLETVATFAERREAMHEAGDAAVNERKEREAAWDEIEAVLKKVGTVGLQFLVKVALKVVGI